MSNQDIRKVILEELGNIAPEADLASIDPRSDLRDVLDINSIDFLNFITAMHQRLGINVPELDYAKLFTLDGAVAYLQAKSVQGEQAAKG